MPGYAAHTRLSAFHARTVPAVVPETQLDELTRLAMRVCATSMAGVSLLDERGMLFSAGAALGGPRDFAFCRATLEQHESLVVPDAHAEPQFVDCELVVRSPWIRFYAGAPLVMSDGERVGVLWVADERPREPGSFEIQSLESLARQVVTQLALRRTNALLALREGELRSIIDTSGEAIYGVDRSGTCTFVNSACLRILGYAEPEALLGRTMHDLIHYARADGQPYPHEECTVLHAFREGLPLRLEDEVFWRADGTPIWAIYTASPLYRDEQLIGSVINFVDVTEQRRVREELVTAARVRDRFTGVLGHDLRNPLATMLMGAQRIAKSETSEATRNVAIRMGHAAERMQRLIADLLDFMRVREGGALKLNPRRTDLAVVAREIVGEFELAHPGRRITVETAEDAVGEWDADRLAQVCSNLLANAINHGAREGLVQMRVRASPDHASLIVENAGPPIPDALRPYLFDPFRRGGSNGHGLGLGLFIVREVALAHGGRVDFTSDLDGTAFTVRLPRDARLAV